MIDEKKRDEFFDHIEPYLYDEPEEQDDEFINDLYEMCKYCKKYARLDSDGNCVRGVHDFYVCRGCKLLETWLAAGYGAWALSYN